MPEHTDLIKEFERLAESVKNQLNLGYDAASVKFVEGFIERNKVTDDLVGNDGLINSIGAYLGQCIISCYGGSWEIDPKNQTASIVFDAGNKAFPFSKTAKQFENGLGDSIYSFFTVLPIVFKSLPLLPETYDNPPAKLVAAAIKPWWKFW